MRTVCISATCHAELLKLLLQGGSMSRRQFTRSNDVAKPRRWRWRWRLREPVRWAGGRTQLWRCTRGRISQPRRRRCIMRRPMPNGIQHLRRRILLRTGERYVWWNRRTGLLDRIQWRHRRMGRSDNCTVYWAILCKTLHSHSSKLTHATTSGT